MGNKPIKLENPDMELGSTEDMTEYENDSEHGDEIPIAIGNLFGTVREEVQSEDDSSSSESETEENSDSEVVVQRRSKRNMGRKRPCYRDDTVFCDFCPESFHTEEALLAHKQTDHIEELTKEEDDDQTREAVKYSRKRNLKYGCPQCIWLFSLEEHLLNHTKREHKNSQLAREADANDDEESDWDTWNEEYEQIKYARKYNKRKRRPHECPRCYRSYSTKEAVSFHLNKWHTDKRQIGLVSSGVNCAPDRRQTTNNIPSTSHSVPGTSIGKSVLPNQDPNEFVVLWSDSLEDVLLDFARKNANTFILLIKGLDFWKLTEEQIKIISASNQCTFMMPKEGGTLSVWSVIVFNKEKSPMIRNNTMFQTFADVEKFFIEHAESCAKVIHHVVTAGLLPLLSSSLKEKVTKW